MTPQTEQPSKMNWVKEKPDLSKECLLMTATWIDGPYSKYWDYKLWNILKVECPEGWYFGLHDQDYEEWGDYQEDLTADLYCILPLLKNK